MPSNEWIEDINTWNCFLRISNLRSNCSDFSCWEMGKKLLSKWQKLITPGIKYNKFLNDEFIIYIYIYIPSVLPVLLVECQV